MQEQDWETLRRSGFGEDSIDESGTHNRDGFLPVRAFSWVGARDGF